MAERHTDGRTSLQRLEIKHADDLRVVMSNHQPAPIKRNRQLGRRVSGLQRRDQ